MKLYVYHTTSTSTEVHKLPETSNIISESSYVKFF